MADTRYLRATVEPYVRERLAEEHGRPFASQRVKLRAGGDHEFDAVSDDGTVVCAIKTASGRTATGKVPAGKFKDAEAELYYLTQIAAPTRILILTTPEFHDLMKRRLQGRLDPGISLRLMQLPADMQARVTIIQRSASAEMGTR